MADYIIKPPVYTCPVCGLGCDTPGWKCTHDKTRPTADATIRALVAAAKNAARFIENADCLCPGLDHQSTCEIPRRLAELNAAIGIGRAWMEVTP